MVSNWQTTEQSDPRWQGIEEQRTIIIIQELLEDVTNPDDAAKDIAALYESRLTTGDTDLWSLWTLVCHAVIHPSNGLDRLERLVQMIACISRLPDVRVRGRPITENERIYWRDLPEFSFWFREHAMNVYYIEDIDEGRTPITWSDQTCNYLAANSFAAMYLRMLNPSGSTFEFAAMKQTAQYALMEALEVPTDTTQQIRRAAIYVPAASQWMRICGDDIYKFCLEQEGYSGQNVSPRRIGGSDGGEQLWTGADGFSLKRWNFWAQRFEEISKLTGKAIDSVINSAIEAVEAIMKFGQEL